MTCTIFLEVVKVLVVMILIHLWSKCEDFLSSFGDVPLDRLFPKVVISEANSMAAASATVSQTVLEIPSCAVTSLQIKS